MRQWLGLDFRFEYCYLLFVLLLQYTFLIVLLTTLHKTHKINEFWHLRQMLCSNALLLGLCFYLSSTSMFLPPKELRAEKTTATMQQSSWIITIWNVILLTYLRDRAFRNLSRALSCFRSKVLLLRWDIDNRRTAELTASPVASYLPHPTHRPALL